MGIRDIAKGRKDVWKLDPEDVVIPGIDNDDTPKTNKLHDGSRSSRDIPEGFIQHIMGTKKGVITPIVITWKGKGTASYAEVVEGRRRLRACRIANQRLKKLGRDIKLVECVLEQDAPDNDLEEIMFGANAFHLDDLPSHKAEAAARLREGTEENPGKSEAQIGLIFGVTRQVINNRLHFHQCEPEVKDAVDDGLVNFSDAFPLYKLSREEQLEKLEELKAKKGGGSNDEGGGSPGGGGGGGGGSDKPGKKLVFKVLEHDDAQGVLGDRAISFAKWIFGEVQAEEVEGLDGIIDELEEE